jgi:LacI family transcriptional regulator
MANQRAIAAALGITQSTVARALQGSHLVSDETRQRVEEAARKFGYQPNPMVSALMERIRTGKEVLEQGSIAILASRDFKKGWPQDAEAYKLQHQGWTQRAARNGFRTEVFYYGEDGVSDHALDRILYSRGFSGVILGAPYTLNKTSFDLRFERYSLATISVKWHTLSIDRAATDHAANVTLAFNELVKRGYRRIGLVLPGEALEIGQNRWLASYLNHQYHQSRSFRIPVFEGSPKTCPMAKFRAWHNRWKPEVILCLLGEEMLWLNEMGLSPTDLGLACLNRPEISRFSGVEESNVLVGELACQIVINHIIHNERGLSAQPTITRVQGRWIEGDTLPDRKPEKGS